MRAPLLRSKELRVPPSLGGKGEPNRTRSLGDFPHLGSLSRFATLIEASAGAGEGEQEERQMLNTALQDEHTYPSTTWVGAGGFDWSVRNIPHNAITAAVIPYNTSCCTLGRQMGDELLKQVAQRLQHSQPRCVRRGTHWHQQLRHRRTDARDAGAVAMAVDYLLRACFDTPFALGGAELRMAAKAGVALYPMDGADAETLLRNAEAAANKAKASADSMLFYMSEMNTRVAEALGRKAACAMPWSAGNLFCTTSPSGACPLAPWQAQRP